MKDWVKPLLRRLRPEKVSPEAFDAELSQPPLVWRRLAGLFLHDFRSDGMVELLGSVLADLPPWEFDLLFRTRPFFILAKSPGFVQSLHATGSLVLIIFHESELQPMTWTERRGVIIHELVHVLKSHATRPFSLDDPHRSALEAQCDDTARELGFSEEIDAVRRYVKKKERRLNHGRI